MSTSSLNIIRPDELKEIPADSIGKGVYGNCFLKELKRFGITVVEKQLIDNNTDMLYKEALSMQKFSHRCIPMLLGVQLEKKPVSLVMQFIGQNNKSITVFKLLFDPQYGHQALEMSTKTWLRICYDITDALDHMHQRGFLHQGRIFWHPPRIFFNPPPEWFGTPSKFFSTPPPPSHSKIILKGKIEASRIYFKQFKNSSIYP